MRAALQVLHSSQGVPLVKPVPRVSAVQAECAKLERMASKYSQACAFQTNIRMVCAS